jgi:hypothetical protein
LAYKSRCVLLIMDIDAHWDCYRPQSILGSHWGDWLMRIGFVGHCGAALASHERVITKTTGGAEI